MKFAPCFATIFTFCGVCAAGAVTLDLPANSENTLQEVDGHSSYELPVGPWRDGAIDTRTIEGVISQQVWRLPASDLTTLQILEPMREQLVADGYRVLFECKDEECGGFDFRFTTRVAPEPDMHVNLGDYRFLSAERVNGTNPSESISILVSRSSNTGYVQLITGNTEIVANGVQQAPSVTEEPVQTETDATIGQQLERDGSVVLDDLAFAVGADALEENQYDSLSEIANYLNAHADAVVVLVGHTDAEGSLEANIALSKRRANAVLEELVARYGAPREQLRAEGVGFLAPRSSNLTEEGRASNRRVEAVLENIELSR